MEENSEGMKNMSVEIKTDEDVVTSFLSGEIDHHVALPIREKTDAAIISAHPKRVVLDFSGVTFMDSSGIGLGQIQDMREYGSLTRNSRPVTPCI